MTRVSKDKRHILLEAESERTCELCGKTAECRPYGPNGADICYDCGTTMPEVVKQQMDKRFLGDAT